MNTQTQEKREGKEEGRKGSFLLIVNGLNDLSSPFEVAILARIEQIKKASNNAYWTGKEQIFNIIERKA